MGNTLATKAINWGLMAGKVEKEGSTLLFAKIHGGAYVVVPESPRAISAAPMVVLNPDQPIVRGGLAKRFAAELLGVHHRRVSAYVISCMIKATTESYKLGSFDPASIVSRKLPFEIALGDGDPPSSLSMFPTPGWIIELLEYQELNISWVDVKELLESLLPRSLLVDPRTDFDADSWVLATTHNVSQDLVVLMEHHGYALRRRGPRRKE